MRIRGSPGLGDTEREKLQSIVDYSVAYPGPVIDPLFPGATAASFYWSATTSAIDFDIGVGSAWFVGFNFGSVGEDGKFRDKHARAVRAGSD